MDPVDQAVAIADILVERFDQIKYHPHASIWGVASYWNEEEKKLEDELQQNSFYGFIDFLLDQPGMMKPRVIIPGQDVLTRKILSCATNAARIYPFFVDVVGGSAELEHIVSEKHLLGKAAKQYLKWSDALDFWEFLLKYDVEKETLGTGSYQHLVERLYAAYGEEIETTAMKLLEKPVQDQMIERYRQQHAPALPNAHLEKLMGGIRVDGNPMQDLRTAKSTVSAYLGKVRIRTGGSTVMDFASWIENKKRLENLRLQINYEEWTRAVLYQQEAERAWNMARENPDTALIHYEQMTEDEANPEQKSIYQKIVKELELLALFKDTPYFHRTMTVHTTTTEERT